MWLTLLVSAALYGQTYLATVTGVVTDSTKAVIVGITVTIRNTETNISHTITTNEDGYFTITSLPPGPYELTASKPGFGTYRQPGIVLETGQQLRNDIQLNVGAVSQTINVTAEAAPLNTQDGAIKGAVIGQQEIQDIPLDGRDFTSLAFLVPGVAPAAQGAEGSTMSVNGARADNSGYRIDGFDDRTARGGDVPVASQYRRFGGVQDGDQRLLRPVRQHCGRHHEHGSEIGDEPVAWDGL